MNQFKIVGIALTSFILMFSQAGLADGRTELSGPGEAEVIAGTGYTHTLFDSADNKCQHCHNDLYDTWKTSMHAKSWKDPIFQSKYQDFLRLQASKIGAVGPTGTYQEGTIQKTAQVCIKCHAPTAYYSGDFKITLTEVGDQNVDPDAFEDARALQTNLAPAYNPDLEATVSSMAQSGKVYTVSYHVGNKHNREGINCAYCHSIETVRMMNDVDGDLGQYTLAKPMKMGPIGPLVHNAGDTLHYSPDASTHDMNAFFALIGPEKYADVSNTPKDAAGFDIAKAADGRYTMKSIPVGCDGTDADGNPADCHYTGGPFYGPFGITGVSNSRDDDVTDRASLVKGDFQAAVDADHGDKFESRHQFAAYGKALCLSCHQRSSLMLNPETNGIPGLQPGDDQFLELCSTWTAMSDGVGNNFEDSKTSPKCQQCHMEPLANKTVLHKWDDPDSLFTAKDGVTEHFDPASGVGPVAEGYLNNHAFMGANKADFGLTKIKTGFESGMEVKADDDKLKVKTYLQNKTAHMFPGAHPMRRVLTRVVVTDANGNKLSFKKAKGKSRFKSVTNQLAVLEGNTILPGHETVKVKYDDDRKIVIQGYTADLSSKKEPVNSQFMDGTLVEWVSPDATVTGSTAVETAPGVWAVKGVTTVKKITDIEGAADHFTRIYGRETGKRMADGTHVVRPGFDSNIATDNRLKPNEKEKYTVVYDIEDAVFPLTVKYKVYYMKKGASGKFPTAADGFLNTSLPAETLKKLAIYEVFSAEEKVVDDD
ncbi:MAG: cytochrome c family protein [Gammaproteobacteria bacterium]|nr:cytochrome c family protein [Gammaproteobacteria bacterium]